MTPFPMLTVNEEAVEAAARWLARLRVLSSAQSDRVTLSEDDIARYVEHCWRDWLDEARAALTAAIPHLSPWQPIETAPVDEDVLLYCPELDPQFNPERIELGRAHSSRGSHHSWATHWMPLPAPLGATPPPAPPSNTFTEAQVRADER